VRKKPSVDEIARHRSRIALASRPPRRRRGTGREPDALRHRRRRDAIVGVPVGTDAKPLSGRRPLETLRRDIDGRRPTHRRRDARRDSNTPLRGPRRSHRRGDRRHRPDVVGVQEAAHLRVQAESDFSEDPTPNASTTVVDLLDLLASALDDRGLSYDVATETVTTDIEVPAADDGGTTDVRLTDRTALLVRSDLETTGTRSVTFDSALRYRLQGATVAIERGFSQVDVSLDGADVAVANAHLESADGDTRADQAAELRDELPTDRPVVLAGDLNSGPDGPTAAYDLLTESFADPASDGESDDVAPTCCQASDLRNETSELTRRVDHLLSRGDVELTGVERVGASGLARDR